MSKFHSLQVIDVTRETPDAVSVAFEVPENLKNEYKYIQGQYLTLKLNINGEEVRRSYSICSTHSEKELRVAIKKVKAGWGSVFINDKIKIGDSIEVMVPMGNFYTPINSTNKKNYVLFAGGSGITPMMSIIKTVLSDEPKSSIVLFYGNQNESSIIFKKQLEELTSKNVDRLRVYHILNEGNENVDELFRGVMTIEKSKALIAKYIDVKFDNEFFVCGPTVMMDNVRKALEESKVDKNSIHIEYFTTPVEPPKTDLNKSEYVACTATIILDGDERIIQIPAGESVLQAALDASMDAPYACRGGSCCTCRAKLIEGKVIMDVNYALLDSEVAEGYILTCQSHPITPTVIVDYDKGR